MTKTKQIDRRRREEAIYICYWYIWGMSRTTTEMTTFITEPDEVIKKSETGLGWRNPHFLGERGLVFARTYLRMMLFIDAKYY